MRIRLLVLAAVSTAAGVATSRALARRSPPGQPAAAGSWQSCSAPSARWYEAIFGGPLRGLQQHVAADLLALAGDSVIGDVLEIGPGPGILAEQLARLAPTIRIVGVDIDPAMVERAAARAADAGIDDRVTFQVGDVARLPFADDSFDLVTSTFSVHHWADADAGFAEIGRVLRPGGLAAIYDLPDWLGRLERRAPPLARSAAGAPLAETSMSVLRWPGRLPIASRLTGTA